jgi:hypothetical protein
MIYQRYLYSFTIIMSLVAMMAGCHKNNNSSSQVVTPPPALTGTTPVLGYNLLAKICGIWNGGVTSATALGSYPEWIVDMRPISAGQVSAKNELDTLNSIFMSFFITYYNSQYRLAFRNGGSFAGMTRVSYLMADSVNETATQSYYRFSDFVKGTRRAYIEVYFRSDSLILTAYTNKSNSVEPAVLHMTWQAKLQDTTSCAAAKAAFNFPQKTLVKNLTGAFATDSESIFYMASSADPYPESAQPYLGISNLSYSVVSGITLPAGRNTYLIATTQPLVSGFTFNTANLIYRSRYVILNGNDQSFRFNYMHPGNYYLYAFCDADGNGAINSGDYVSTANVPFSLAPLDSVPATAQINYQIP